VGARLRHAQGCGIGGDDALRALLPFLAVLAPAVAAQDDESLTETQAEPQEPDSEVPS